MFRIIFFVIFTAFLCLLALTIYAVNIGKKDLWQKKLLQAYAALLISLVLTLLIFHSSPVKYEHYTPASLSNDGKLVPAVAK